MEQAKKEDFDIFLIQIQQDLEGKRDQDCEELPEEDFGLGFRIKIPGGFFSADEETKAAVFWSQKRPPVILLTPDRKAGITFQILKCGMKNGRDGLAECRKTVQRILERVDDRTVFYDMGDARRDGMVLWLEYKSFASDETIYNILSLFEASGRIVMGTFYCIFEDYDKWKPMILDMFSTIREADEDEGL